MQQRAGAQDSRSCLFAILEEELWLNSRPKRVHRLGLCSRSDTSFLLHRRAGHTGEDTLVSQAPGWFVVERRHWGTMFGSFNLLHTFLSLPGAVSSSLCLVIPSCQFGCLRKIVFTHTGNVTVAELPPVRHRVGEPGPVLWLCRSPWMCAGLWHGASPALETWTNRHRSWCPCAALRAGCGNTAPRAALGPTHAPRAMPTALIPCPARVPNPPSCPCPLGSEAPATSSTTAGSQEAGCTS